MDAITSESACNGHVEANVIIRPATNTHKKSHKSKHSLIDDKKSRRTLERTIADLQRKLSHQEIIIASMQRSAANPNISNVPTSNRYDEITPHMDEEDEMLEPENDEPHAVAQQALIVGKPKYNITHVPAADHPKTTKNSTKKTAPTGAIPNKPQQATSTAATAPIVPKPHKPPPVVITNIDCKKLTTILTEAIGEDAFSFRRVSAKVTHVNTKTLANFKTVCDIMKESDAEHHTFTPKEEQHTNIVLRHLDKSYDAADIAHGIASLSLDVKVVRVMRLPTNQNSLWLIQLQAGSDANQLLQQRFFLHQNVVFERKKQNSIAQCKNCQLFGHSARNCNHKYRCVKCQESHLPGHCPRSLDQQLANDTPPACVNCKTIGHPANFRGCPYYTQILQRKQKQAQVQPPHQPTQHSMRTADKSFASVLKKSSTTTAQPPNMFDFFDNECKKHFNMEFAELQTKMKEFYPTYINLPADKKAMAIMGFTLSLST